MSEGPVSKPTRARVVIVGGVGSVEPLDYAVPEEMAGRIALGHRVVVPVRSRRFTGVVLELGDGVEAGYGLKPIAELLEERALFDTAHLKLMEFMLSYYMVSPGDAYRSVIPGVARVESRRFYRLVGSPPPLAAAALTVTERALLEELERRPMTARQLRRIAAPREVAAALARFCSEGWVDLREGTRGRHRGGVAMAARATANAAGAKVRGLRQREILASLVQAGDAGVALDVLEEQVETAGSILRAMASRGIVELFECMPQTTSSDGSAAAISPSLELNEEQRLVLAAATPAVAEARFEAFLLWGVTAGGKTEIYLRLAETALAAGRKVLLLVPEIALADQLVRSFRARFGGLVGIVHSAQSVSDRWASWMAALHGSARIMIGPRSAVFAPIHDLGLIVVDEEHDPSYKQEEGIRYNARDLAVALARESDCPIVLGSATPSAESFFNVRRGRYKLLRILRRVQERAMAKVELIDLRKPPEEKEVESKPVPVADSDSGPPIPISDALLQALRENLDQKGQSLIFLNRRGFFGSLQCHLCGSVIACPNCSVSMTFHMRDRSMRCHYCGNRITAPDKCPECAGFGLAGQGFGTERLTAALSGLLPQARLERMDSDASGRGGARTRILDALRRGEIDILVGTQMITKGFDFPGVTLVGVVLADLALNMPDFRSAERTFQLLTQVAGRAGRGDQPGRVLIQTYAPNHYSIRAARDQDYERFIRRELQLRREMGYPPFARLAMTRIEGADASRVSALADRAARALIRASKDIESIRVLGPAPAPIERIRNRYRWQVMVKAEELKPMREVLTAMRAEVAPLAKRDQVFLSIDIDPVNMM